MSTHLYSVLRVRQDGPLVVLQPWEGDKMAGKSLTVDLSNGKVRLADVPEMRTRYKDAFGVAGLAKLVDSYALVLLTGGEAVAKLRGSVVWRLKESAIMTNTDEMKKTHPDNAKFCKLLDDAFFAEGSGRGLHFSFDTDLTQTQQRVAEATDSSRSLHASADLRFFWNKTLLKPLIDAGASQFAVPVVLASVHQLPALPLGGDTSATITLIARRSSQRAGTRHWRRGADPQGSVANFVETEQLVEIKGPAGTLLSSYVQVRGSIPIIWSQSPNMKYKPTTRIAPPEVYGPAFQRHARALLAQYKEVRAVNLVNQHGSEGILSTAFTEEAARFAKDNPGFSLISFDFHKECGAASYHNLSKLWSALRPDWERYGFYSSGGETGGEASQSGVVRTNCIDCLDRTNVVQGLLGRKHLEAVLARAQLGTQGAALEVSFPQVHQAFRVIWADHGDDISRQYAGTGALKSGFTRTGKRTTWGLLDDGIKSVTRYYLNTFQDGRKQDAFDFATGSYVASADKETPFTSQKSAVVPLAAATVSFVFGLVMTYLLVTGEQESSVYNVLQMAIMPLGMAFLLFSFVMKNGSALVTKPQLRPDLTQAWK